MSDHPDQSDLESLLDALGQAQIEFIVVGGAAAVLHGAPVTTLDVDVVHNTDEANVAKLIALLKTLHARVRDPAGQAMNPDREALRGAGQVKLTTERGPLDILGSLHDGRTYADLLPHTVEVTDGSLRLRVLDLPRLIEIKSSTGRTREQQREQKG